MKTILTFLLIGSLSLALYAGGEGKLSSKPVRMSDQILQKLSLKRFDLESEKTAATVLFRINESNIIEVLEIQGGDEDFNDKIRETLHGKKAIPTDISREHVYSVRIIYSKM